MFGGFDGFLVAFDHGLKVFKQFLVVFDSLCFFYHF